MNLKKIKIDFTNTNFGFVEAVDADSYTIFIEYPDFPDPETNHYAYQYWLHYNKKTAVTTILIQLWPDEDEDMEAYELDLTPEQQAQIEEHIRSSVQ